MQCGFRRRTDCHSQHRAGPPRIGDAIASEPGLLTVWWVWNERTAPRKRSAALGREGCVLEAHFRVRLVRLNLVRLCLGCVSLHDRRSLGGRTLSGILEVRLRMALQRSDLLVVMIPVVMLMVHLGVGIQRAGLDL